MPYTDWNYTNPGWTNENPPAINESNLNDIASALSKLNLTSEQLSQLGLTTANGLGDIISKLVENIENISTELDQTNTDLSKKGTMTPTIYTYSGNGSDTVSISLDNPPYDGYVPAAAFIISSNSNPDRATTMGVCIYGTALYYAIGTANNIQGSMTFTQNRLVLNNASMTRLNDSYKQYRVTVI